MQNKHGLIFVAQSKLIAFYWKTWTFHGFGQMCLFEVLGKWWSILDNPSQKLTELVPALWDQQHCFFLQYCTWYHIYIQISKIWKWNETAFIWGASSKDFGCLMERRVGFANWWDRFWKADNWYWTLRVSMLNCQTKMLTDATFQGFVHMTFKHRPPGKYWKENSH